MEKKQQHLNNPLKGISLVNLTEEERHYIKELEYTRQYLITLIPTLIFAFIYLIFYMYLLAACSADQCNAAMAKKD